jgi:hypothetical protein
VGELLGEKKLEERLEDIRDIIKRMDTRWDHGFFADEQDYLEQRLRLQQETEQLTPVPDDTLQWRPICWRILVTAGRILKATKMVVRRWCN